jgi:hypothetical protein
MNDSWLDQLSPEHAPPAPGWWPPAPGWWLLAFLSLALAITAFMVWRHPRRRLRRATLRELNRIRTRSDADVTAAAQAIQNLLRRYALALFGAECVARLQGTAWLQFLDEHSGGAFAGDRGESLLSSSYGAAARGAAADPAAWFAAAEQFVRRAARKPRRAPRSKRAVRAADPAADAAAPGGSS